MTDPDKYHELLVYTLSLGDSEFIHQHMVDAYAAQVADESTKPIALFFSVAGLYLFVEKNYSGRQVQQAHQAMASKTKNFIRIDLPLNRGAITISEVLRAPLGHDRNLMIKKWARSVWDSYSDQHERIIEETNKLLPGAG